MIEDLETAMEQLKEIAEDYMKHSLKQEPHFRMIGALVDDAKDFLCHTVRHLLLFADNIREVALSRRAGVLGIDLYPDGFDVARLPAEEFPVIVVNVTCLGYPGACSGLA